MTASTTRGPVNGLEMDVSDQGNVSQSASASRRSNQQNVRHRASVACFSCRDRRIRCVVPKGSSACIQCKRSGTNCVIKMDDERRRPVSKAYVSSLSARIAMLESMLQERGVAVPPAAHPPMTKHDAQSGSHGDELRVSTTEAPGGWSQSDSNSPIRHVLSPPDSHHDFTMQESPAEGGLISTDTINLESESSQKDLPQFQASDSTKQGDAVQQPAFTSGALPHDRLLGRLRFFDPAVNQHLCANLDGHNSKEPAEQVRRAERVIRSLTPKTHDYLMQNFWKFYNLALQLVDKTAFEADKGSENPKFYSSFLHVVILAIGWRFADQDRCDIARMNLGNGKSTLHQEARNMLDLELERSVGITSVQSLLLLGDLECGVGRDNIGGMYASMANRLAFDIGLHLDGSSLGLPKQEIGIQHRVMRACILLDRYWALYLGRPTSIKTRDVCWDLSKSSFATTRSLEQNPGAPVDPHIMEEEIYDQLYELVDLASCIIEGRDTNRSSRSTNPAASFDNDKKGNNGPSRALKLDQGLQNWYERLPNYLTWRLENIRTAPSSFFLLHEQYHAITILLHRSRESHPLTPNDALTPKSPLSLDAVNGSGTEYDFASHQEVGSHNATPLAAESARNICTRAAVQLAQVIAQYKKRYELEKICWTNLQPAGTASLALLAAISHAKDETERRNYLSCLKVLVDAIHNMSHLYQPAAKWSNLLHSLLAQLRLDARELRQDRAISFGQGVNGSRDGAGSRYQEEDTFTSAPGRQEHYDRDQPIRNKRRHTTQIPYTPEFTGHLPPFHVPVSPPYTQQAFNHNSNSLSGTFSATPETSDTFFNMDSFWNPSMSTDSGYTSRGNSDTYLRVAPSAKGWALQSLHAASQLVQNSSPPFDSNIPDWMAGSTGFSTATTFQGAGLDSQSTAQLTSGSNFRDPWGCKREDASSLMWMSGGHNSMHALPGPEGIAPPRKHELDFLVL